MVKRQGGSRKRSRSKLSKRSRDAGKVTISRILKKFQVGDRVLVMIESAVHGGMPHIRYYSKHGDVVGTQGTNYKVQVIVGSKKKMLIMAPVHMRKM